MTEPKLIATPQERMTHMYLKGYDIGSDGGARRLQLRFLDGSTIEIPIDGNNEPVLARPCRHRRMETQSEATHRLHCELQNELIDALAKAEAEGKP